MFLTAFIKRWGVKMSGEVNATIDKIKAKYKPIAKSIIEEFELSDKLPVGIASDIRIMELRGGEEMKDGDIHDIYSSACVGFTIQNEQFPECFTFSEVRKFYGK